MENAASSRRGAALMRQRRALDADVEDAHAEESHAEEAANSRRSRRAALARQSLTRPRSAERGTTPVEPRPVFIETRPTAAMMCGAPATVSLIEGFSYVADCRPLPRQVRVVRAEDGLCDDDADGTLAPWHMFARRQIVRGGSAVLLALQEDVARFSHPAFIPAREWGAWVRCLRQMEAGVLHQRFMGADTGTRSLFGLWALSVNSAIQNQEGSVAVVNALPLFPSLPAQLRQP